MKQLIPNCRRLVTATSRYDCNARPCISTRPLSSRLQHTKATQPPIPSTSPKNGNKPRRQTSRAGTTALILVGLASACGLQQAFQSGSTSPKSLNNSTFTPFTLVAKEQVSSTCSIFTLDQPNQSQAARDAIQDMWKKGVWSIEIKQPQLQIARSYTPLPPLSSEQDNSTAAENNDQLRLLVRKEQKGEMSNYIHKTSIGGSLELRGPAVEYTLPAHVNRVVFLAGGTGIAPALQIAHTLQQRQHQSPEGVTSNDIPHLSILWANRKREDCKGGVNDNNNITSSTSWTSWLSSLVTSTTPSPISQDDHVSPSGNNAIVSQINAMKHAHPGAVATTYYIDEEATVIQLSDVLATISSAPISPTTTNPTNDASTGANLIFVSGPEGFLNYWAGPKEWKDGREVQGPLGGVLSRMGIRGWEVVKL